MRAVPNKTFSKGPLEEKIPISFGGNFQDDPILRSTLRKSQVLQMEPPLKSELRGPHTSYNFNGTHDRGEGLAFTLHERSSAKYGESQRSSLANSVTSAAAVAESSETVLRFLGYFKEKVPESQIEATRLRKVAFIFHVADSTLAIREANQINSGLAQGQFLRRQKVPKNGQSGSDLLSPEDFYIGAALNIYGRTFCILDMDENSRKYYREVLGKTDVPDMGLPWPTSEDAYNAKMGAKLAGKPKKQIPTADMDYKRAMESLHGGLISKHAPDDIRIAQQFFENRINEHLQFAVLWDERNQISGDLRFGVVKYYLENDTCEVIEKRDENCGREGGAKVLMRQRIPKQGLIATELGAQQNTYGVLLKNQYMVATDFHIGETISIHNKKYLIYDADTFTRAFLQNNYDIELPPAKDISHIVQKGVRPVPKQYPPPHNGFGSEEDSLQNWKSLLVKPPRVNRDELEREHGKVMIFRAEFDGGVAPEDEGRQFIVAFHRATKEVEISERQVRNSGIVGGKFLARGKHLKVLPDGRNVPYTPGDFVVGQSVVIAGRKMRLLEMDEKSRRQIENIEDSVKEERVRELIVAFRTMISSKFYRMHEAYRRLAPEGALTITEVRSFFAQASCPISEKEAVLVVKYFAPNGNGIISFDDFVAIMRVDHTASFDVSSNNPNAVKNIDMDLEGSNHLESCRTAASLSHRKKLKKRCIEKITQRRGTVVEVFRLMAGHAPTARLSQTEFRHGLKDVLQLLLSKEDEDLLLSMVFLVLREGQRTVVDEIDFKTFHLFVEEDEEQ